jgi:glutamate synthase (NADPH/NADH) small chain
LANNIPEFNDFVSKGRWKEALAILTSTSSFPELTARICPAPCEASCVLGINDDAVTIRQIEIAIIEKGFELGLIKPVRPAVRIDKSIAVIGAGPAGMVLADMLNKWGYNVTVYEKDKQVGGLLRYGIPDFKLDKKVIDRRVEMMSHEGVVFELGVSVGTDISFNYLKDRFNAICLTGGAREPRDLKIPGREFSGIHFAMDYLTQQNRKNAGEPVRGDEISAAGKNVVVIGGGDTGADCIGTALRQGAKKVVQMEIMPEPPQTRPDSTPWPSWPNILRTSSSHKEGGERMWAVNTKLFLGREGKVSALNTIEVEWFKGSDGRMQFKEKPGTEKIIDADLVMLALGFVGPGKNKLVDDLGIAKDERGNIKVDAAGMTSVTGIFAAGDMARGQSLVVRAMSDARKTAESIKEYLGK